MTSVDQPVPVAPLPSLADLLLHQQFWTRRPILTHIHAFARARRTSPWAVLGVVLARACTAVPPFVMLPAQVGAPASLNLFVGLVGPSGSGKDAAARAAEDAVPVGHLDTAGVGSGEGIAHQFVVYRKPNAKTGDAGGLEQYRRALLMTAAEVDTIAALHGRQSSTLLPELRKAWMGHALGFAYVDPTKRLTLTRHSYRLCLIVGIQRERAGAIVSDADGGTPQRYLWLPSIDPDAPDIAPAEPLPWSSWRLSTWPVADVYGRVILPVCQGAREMIDTAWLARARGNGEALDGHALLCRLKFAAVLGILNGRAEVSDEDWGLAGVVMATSDRTRRSVVEALQRVQRTANATRAKAEGERSVIAAETVTEHAVRRVCALIMSKLAAGPDYGISHSVLRRSLNSRDRDYFETAIDRLIGAGLIVAGRSFNTDYGDEEHRLYKLTRRSP